MHAPGGTRSTQIAVPSMARAHSGAGLALARETAQVFRRLAEDALRPYSCTGQGYRIWKFAN
jgi:hypothetical protein